MSIKAGVIQKVVALPVTEIPVDREGGIQSPLRVSEIGTLAIARVKKSANQSAGAGAEVIITWDQEDFDTAVLHDNAVNNTRFTIPIAGKYRLEVVLGYASDATGKRDVFYKITGGTSVLMAAIPASPTEITVVNASAVLDLAAGDYVEVVGRQTTAGALNITAAQSYAMLQYLGE